MKKTNSKVIWVIGFLLIILCFTKCGLEEEPKLVDSNSQYACPGYKIVNSNFEPNVKIYFRVEPVVFGDVPYTEELGNILEKKLNDKYNKGNIHFKVTPPIYKELFSGDNSYMTYLDSYYNPLSIRVLIISDSIRFVEERLRIINGSSFGIPTIENPSTGKPIIFIRHSKLTTDLVVHEFGHVFGLFHTFEGKDVTNKGLNCDCGDEIPTTITPDPLGSFYMEGCDYYLPDGKKDDYTAEEINNIVENPMGYAREYCMKDLNKEQFQRIRKIIEVNSRLQDCIVKLEE